MDNQNFQPQMPNQGEFNPAPQGGFNPAPQGGFNPAPQGGFAPAPAANNKKFITIGAIAIIVIALVFGLISCLSSNSPKGVVKAYIKAMYKPDFKKANSLQLRGGQKYYEYLADENDMDVDEYFETMSDEKASSYSEFCKYMNKERKKDLEEGDDDLGENIKLSKIEIKKDKKLSKKKLKDIKKSFEDNDYIDDDKITDAHEIKVKVTIKGDDDSDSDIDTVTVVKYKGSWKILG